MRPILALLGLTAALAPVVLAPPSHAQAPAPVLVTPQRATAGTPPLVLYAGLNKSRGYVVGSKLSESGLHRFMGDGGRPDARRDTLWQHLGWSTPRISGLAVDPSDPARRYIASGNGAMVSTTGGAAWRIPTDWRVTEVQDVAADAAGRVVIGTAYGPWRSADRGATWAEAADGIPLMQRYTQDVEMDAARAGRVVAATDGGVYVSDDGAASWRRASAALSVQDVAQSASAPETWYAATRGRGLWRSTDGARTWTPTATAFRDSTFYGVAVDPYDARRVAAASWNAGVVVSADGGRTWTARTRGLPVARLYCVVFDANRAGRLWAATVERGIFRSDDMGGTCRYAGMTGTLVFDLVFLPDAPGAAFATPDASAR